MKTFCAHESLESLIKTQDNLSKQADLLERLIDPLLNQPARFVSRTERFLGEDFVVVDDLREIPNHYKNLTCVDVPRRVTKSSPLQMAFPKIEMGIKCPKTSRLEFKHFSTDSSIGYRSLRNYFGLSDSENIIIRFNIVEHHETEFHPRFTRSVSLLGKRLRKAKPISHGVEAKEVIHGSFIKFLNYVCNRIMWMLESAKFSLTGTITKVLTASPVKFEMYA